MNILRAQQECLKAKVKEDVDKPFKYSWARDARNTYLCDGHKVEAIPNSKYFLDLPEEKKEEKVIFGLMDKAENTEIALDTHIEKISENFTARIFEAGGKEIWINKKLLKNFDLGVSEYLYTENLLFIREDEKIVGLVLEISRSEVY